MKITIIALTCLIGYVAGESCNVNADTCTSTACRTNTTLTCVDSLCTCISRPLGRKCTTRADCAGIVDDQPHHHCHGSEFHCVDGECHCIAD